MSDDNAPQVNPDVSPQNPILVQIPQSPGIIGGSKGGAAPVDQQSVRDHVRLLEEGRPLAAKSSELESDRLARSADVLENSSEQARQENDNILKGAQAAGDKFTQHTDEIWNNVKNMSPLMTRDQYWNSKSTGDKVLAGIGLFLGGASGTDAMQKAIDKDFEIDKAQHEQDFKKYATMHGLDVDELNKAKYMNIVQTAHMVNGLRFAQQDLNAITARSGSQQAKVAGAQGDLELRGAISDWMARGRQAAAAIGAAQAARLDKMRAEVREDAKNYYEKSDGTMSPEQAMEKAIKSNPLAEKTLGAYGLLPGALGKEADANKVISKTISTIKNPTIEDVGNILVQNGQVKNSDGTYGESHFKIGSDGRVTIPRAWENQDNDGSTISNTARKEGRVVQVVDENGKLVQKEAVNNDSAKRIEEFRDAAQKAGQSLKILQDPNSSLEVKKVALEALKNLAPKMETGTQRVAGSKGGLVGSAIDAIEAEGISDKTLSSIRSSINENWKSISNVGIRGGYKGPDLIGSSEKSSTSPGAPLAPPATAHPTVQGHARGPNGEILNTPPPPLPLPINMRPNK